MENGAIVLYDKPLQFDRTQTHILIMSDGTEQPVQIDVWRAVRSRTKSFKRLQILDSENVVVHNNANWG